MQNKQRIRKMYTIGVGTLVGIVLAQYGWLNAMMEKLLKLSVLRDDHNKLAINDEQCAADLNVAVNENEHPELFISCGGFLQ